MTSVQAAHRVVFAVIGSLAVQTLVTHVIVLFSRLQKHAHKAVLFALFRTTSAQVHKTRYCAMLTDTR